MRGRLEVNPPITHEELLRKLIYDPETGLFTNRIARNSSCPIGAIAGCKSKTSGYWVIRLDNFDYLGHRLAWFYVNGVWPENTVDHKDKNRCNNKYDNLREATQSQNCGNIALRKTNTLGYKGVTYQKKKDVYQARIGVGYKRISLGYFRNPEEAADAYDRAAIEHFGEFALTNKMIRERNNNESE